MKKQVDKQHYKFGRYLSKYRWASVWHQVDEVLALSPSSVLEIGPGPGVFQAVAGRFDVPVETFDLDPELKPTHVGTAEALPFADDTFDVVCAFQMLEHVPYDKSLVIFKEMARVARRGIVISLPDAATRWPMAFHIPRVGTKWFSLPKPRFRLKQHQFDGEHYWEINKRGYPVSQVRQDFIDVSSFKVVKEYRVNENPYHRFFVFLSS